MKNVKHLLLALVTLAAFSLQAQEQNITLHEDFDKVIVSPHIEVQFVQAEKAGIVINDINVPIEKLNYEITSGTLHVYLDGAKTTTKHAKIKYEGGKRKVPIYNNTEAKITISYTDVDTFSLRGEENMVFNSPFDQEELTIRVYGESTVSIKEASLEEMRVTLYGESNISIESGNVKKQRITAYGESNVNFKNVESSDAKLTAFGDGTFKFNVSERLKVTSYGDAEIYYKGDAELKKGIVLGEASFSKI